MKGLCRRALALLLVVALLVGAIDAAPASAGTLAVYPPGGAQFTNQDGWVLQGFAANGTSKFSALGWVGVPRILHLETVWQRGSETVEHEYGDQVIVSPETFTWAVDDPSILQLIPYTGLSDDGTDALIFGLREGRTFITVTGPHGKVSKSGVVVMPCEDDVSANYLPAEPSYIEDDWELSNFFVKLNHDWWDGPPQITIGEGETGAVLIDSSWWHQNTHEYLHGMVHLAIEEFTWSVSDTSIAYLQDDYPGTNAKGLVALRPGLVTVTVTGPFGKTASTAIYVMPPDEFGEGPEKPEDPPPDPPGPGTGTGTTDGWGFLEWLRKLFNKEGLVTAISIYPPSIKMYPGEWTMAIATVLPWNAANQNVTWSSSNPSIATVNAYGVVEAIAPGNATITATAQDGSGKKASSPVTVKPWLVESITLSASDMTLFEGETGQLRATVLPASASNTSVTWKSSNTSVATVDQNGLVTAKKAGTVTVTCTAQDKSGVKATCAVTVMPVSVDSLELNAYDITIYVGQSYPLQAIITPANASDKRTTWNITGLLYASVDRNGVVTGHLPGVAQVICRVGDLKATCRVTVEEWPEGLGFEVSYGNPFEDAANGLLYGTNILPYELLRYLLRSIPSGSQLGELLGGEAGLQSLIASATKVIETTFNWLGSLFKWIQGLFGGNKLKVVWPVPTQHVPSDYWGWRKHPDTGEIAFHYGVDVGAKVNGVIKDHTIVAIMDGVVDYVTTSAGARGAVVVMKHNLDGETFYTVYEHLKTDNLPTKGSTILAGKEVGSMSNSGTKDKHLHFELMRSPPEYNSAGVITYSLYSVNPIGTYCNRDYRNTARPISTYNTQPFFNGGAGDKFAYNPNWNFSDPVPGYKNPVISSHHTKYAILEGTEKPNTRPGDEDKE